jgi:hypothetical protein
MARESGPDFRRPLAAADQLVGVGHRFDGVLGALEVFLRDEHLRRRVIELGRMLLHRRV